MSTEKKRHLLGLSGGKDGAALAIYMRDKVPEMEVFYPAGASCKKSCTKDSKACCAKGKKESCAKKS